MDATLELLGELSSLQQGSWLVLDGYHFDGAYQQAMRTNGNKVLVIDDNAHLPAYHADVILNQNLGSERLGYQCDADTVLALGAQDAMRRPAF
ncbi:MAG: UDP-2,4-diacetamido-2,4,6-trideoxy-beta-L-altropyranose hydrolase, partial [Chloroflexi bacterium]|nr:UDP-2,4-diacetamido-2,4,6-trideoxy-beta-L-altropyranose hydrolase [Chloroflexota bacterium]